MTRLLQHRSRQRLLAFALVSAGALVAYIRSFSVPFQFDDLDQIVGNKALRAETIGTLLGWARARIVPFATLALNVRVNGEATFGYHVVNFAVHLVTAFVVFRLALALCETPRLRGTRLADQSLVLATAAAFIFACHPIQVQAVTYIVQRMTSMAAMFYVGSVFFYVTARNRQLGSATGTGAVGFFVAALVCALAAFFSKENSATLPFAILLTELVFYEGLTVRSALRLVPFLVLVVAIPLAWTLLWPRAAPSDATVSEHIERVVHLMAYAVDSKGRSSPKEYFLTQCLVVPRYLRLLVFPSGFNIDHDVPIVHALSAPAAAGFVFLAALLLCGIYAARRLPLLGFGIVWVFLTLAVESSFFPIADVMMEHRMYLPMVGVALAVGTGFSWIFARAPRPALIGGITLGITLIGLTIARNEVWRSPVSLWQDALSKSPDKARVHLNVGVVLHQQHRYEEAIPHFCKVLKMEPDNKLARYDLTVLLNDRLNAQLAADVGDDGKGEEIDLTIEGERGEATVLTATDPCAPE